MTRLPSLLAVAACAHAPRAAAATYDLVLTGGRLVDGAGTPWTYADVGVRAPGRTGAGR
jgi:hypothetical protein